MKQKLQLQGSYRFLHTDHETEFLSAGGGWGVGGVQSVLGDNMVEDVEGRVIL